MCNANNRKPKTVKQYNQIIEQEQVKVYENITELALQSEETTNITEMIMQSEEMINIRELTSQMQERITEPSTKCHLIATQRHQEISPVTAYKQGGEYSIVKLAAAEIGVTPEEAMKLVQKYSPEHEYVYKETILSQYGICGQEPPAFHIIYPQNSRAEGYYAVHTQTGEILHGTMEPQELLYDGFPKLMDVEILEIGRETFGGSVFINAREIIGNHTYYHLKCDDEFDIILRDDGVEFDPELYLEEQTLEPVCYDRFFEPMQLLLP